MKIVHIMTGDLWAGKEAQLFYSLKAMNARSPHDIVAVMFNDGVLYKKLSSAGITTLLIDEAAYNGFRICKQLAAILKKIRPEIVHVHDYKSHILAASATTIFFAKCKIVRTIHGLTPVPFKLRNFKSYTMLQLEKMFLNKYTDALIAVSKDIEMLFRKAYPNTRVSQIYNCIDFPLYPKSSNGEIRKELNIGIDSFWTGLAARLVPIKNIDMIINAARILVEKNLDDLNFRISIFGEGPLKESLQNRIDKHGLKDVVKLHGHREDILSVMNSLDVFVLTSRHEGLPMSLLEAMALGTVPVCTRVGGMQEVIIDGESGFLVELDDAEGLAEILHFLQTHKHELRMIGNNAMQRIKENYSIDQSVEATLSLYETISCCFD